MSTFEWICFTVILSTAGILLGLYIGTLIVGLG